MDRLESIKMRLEYKAVDERDMEYLLQRLEIAQKALEEIVHKSICKGEDCSFGDTCYAVISKLALDQLKEK